MEAIRCQQVSFLYPQASMPALQEVDFHVEAGEFCLLAGKSAAGKSTLLKLLKKEVAPAGTLTGTVEIHGTVGYVSQKIEETLVCDSVRSELSFGLVNLGYAAEQIELLVAETASYFHLEHRLDDEIAALSGGEKQMVNLAAVMIMRPDILLLDEPCSQLDPVWTERFITMLQRLHNDFHLTVILSEQNTELLYKTADSVLLLDNAHLLLQASPEEMALFLKEKKHPMEAFLPVDFRMETYPENGEIAISENLNAPIALEAKQLCFAYEKGKDILNKTSLRVYQGKINAVIGANASGKTTLLKTLAGVYKPYSGRVRAKGNISMLCQNVYDLFTQETCEAEVTFGEMTTLLEINDIRKRHPYDLSGGQAQRLAIAKVLETDADILLFDEPTQGLDCDLKQRLAALLKQLCQAGKTVLLVSHDIEFVGAYCAHAAFLSRGRIVCSAPRQEFFSSLHFYTTALARKTNGRIISFEDIRD